MPVTHVCDLSHHNTIPESLQGAKDAGVVGVIHKMTESNDYVDPTASARCRLAKDAGLLWGIYHFLRPGDMGEQMDYFLTQAAKNMCIDSNTLVCVDYEVTAISLQDVLTALEQLEKIATRSPVLYTGFALKDNGGAASLPALTQYRLWLAQYASQPALPAGYSSYWLWQYTDQGSVPGVNPPVDCNEFSGSVLAGKLDWSGQ